MQPKTVFENFSVPPSKCKGNKREQIRCVIFASTVRIFCVFVPLIHMLLQVCFSKTN